MSLRRKRNTLILDPMQGLVYVLRSLLHSLSPSLSLLHSLSPSLTPSFTHSLLHSLSFTHSLLHSLSPSLSLPDRCRVPGCRYGHTMCHYKGEVYLYGGRNDEDGSFSNIDCYDTSKTRWMPISLLKLTM